MTKNVLFIVGGFPPANAEGGPGLVAFTVAKELKKIGFNPLIITTNKNGGACLPFSGRVDYEGLDVFYGKISLRDFLPYFSVGMFLEIWRCVRNSNVVFLSSSWNLYGWVTAVICQYYKVPYYTYSHGSFHPIRMTKSRIRKALWWKLFDKYVFTNSNATIVMSTEELRQVKEFGIENCLLIPIGINKSLEELLKDVDLTLSNRENLIVSIGRIDPIKDVERTIEFFANNFAKRKFRLVIAGNGEFEYLAKLRELVEKLGVEQSVDFVGTISESQKLEYLLSAKYFVLLSKGEGFPQSLVEAMAAGCIPIVSNGCNFGDAVASGAAINIDDIEGKLKALQYEQTGIQDNVRSYYEENLVWSIIIQKYEKLLLLHKG